METCTSLKGYIDSKETDKDKIVEILKSEFLWDLVETECLAHGYQDVESGAGTQPKREEAPAPEEAREEAPAPSPEPEPETVEPETESEPVASSLDELDDDALLAELDKM
jgi:hypothetical protein